MTDEKRGAGDNRVSLPWLHAGMPEHVNGGPFSQSPIFASTYHLAGDPAGVVDFYGRNSNPTWRALEEVMGAMEGGEAVIFPSGMAAVAAALVPFLRPGDRLLLPSDGYYTVRTFAEAYLAPFGVVVDHYVTAELASRLLEGVALLWIETPSNPGLDVCDIVEAARRMHRAGGLVVCDNTTMTPLGQRCLDLGADMVVSADTKAVNGHSDALMGHVASAQTALIDKVRQWRLVSGSIPGAMEAWMVLRGVQTIEVRFERMCANAAAIAQVVKGHPKLEDVRYPGLEDDPAHAIATRQMHAMGSLLSLTFADAAAADRFLNALEVAYQATSFGGTHSSAESRSRWDTTVHPGLVRFSAGCEPTDVIVIDVIKALEAV